MQQLTLTQSAMPPAFTFSIPSQRRDHTAQLCHAEVRLSTAPHLSASVNTAAAVLTQGFHQLVLTWLTTLIRLHPDSQQIIFLAALHASFPHKSSHVLGHFKPLDTGAAAAQVTRG